MPPTFALARPVARLYNLNIPSLMVYFMVLLAVGSLYHTNETLQFPNIPYMNLNSVNTPGDIASIFDDLVKPIDSGDKHIDAAPYAPVGKPDPAFRNNSRLENSDDKYRKPPKAGKQEAEQDEQEEEDEQDEEDGAEEYGSRGQSTAPSAKPFVHIPDTSPSASIPLPSYKKTVEEYKPLPASVINRMVSDHISKFLPVTAPLRRLVSKPHPTVEPPALQQKSSAALPISPGRSPIARTKKPVIFVFPPAYRSYRF